MINKLFKQLGRLEVIIHLINTGKTGTPEEFAGKIGISQSHLYRVIDELRLYGIPVVYSRSRKTYWYDDKGELKLSSSLQRIDQNGSVKIIAGFLK
jgi:predicted DNA-binding transcriptional regulator YafY